MTWLTADWSNLNPDMAGIVSKDKSGGASLITITPPLPAPTSQLVLRVASRLSGQIDFTHVVKEGDTPASIAQHFTDLINANDTLKQCDIASQLGVPGTDQFFGVTHHADNEMACTALTAPNVIVINNGTQAWDAGPILFLERVPEGQVPERNSNIGQIMFAAPVSTTPGVAACQYGLIACNVWNNDSIEPDAQLAFYTCGRNRLPELRLSISKDGIDIPVGQHISIGGRRVIVDPSGHLRME